MALATLGLLNLHSFTGFRSDILPLQPKLWIPFRLKSDCSWYTFPYNKTWKRSCLSSSISKLDSWEHWWAYLTQKSSLLEARKNVLGSMLAILRAKGVPEDWTQAHARLSLHLLAQWCWVIVVHKHDFWLVPSQRRKEVQVPHTHYT